MPSKKPTVIRPDKVEPGHAPKTISSAEKDFALRLEKAFDDHPTAPGPGERGGRQKWVYDSLMERFSIKVSPEAVRKWFNGTSRPRIKLMSALAQLLEVDEAWLSLGIQPAATPREQKKTNAVAAGAVNYLAAQIQLAGYNIAFPDARSGADFTPDLHAIIHGRQHTFEVKYLQDVESTVLHVGGDGRSQTVVLVVSGGKPLTFEMFRVPATVVEEGRRRGGYVDVKVAKEGRNWVSGKTALPLIKRIEDLNTAD